MSVCKRKLDCAAVLIVTDIIPCVLLSPSDGVILVDPEYFSKEGKKDRKGDSSNSPFFSVILRYLHVYLPFLQFLLKCWLGFAMAAMIWMCLDLTSGGI